MAELRLENVSKRFAAKEEVRALCALSLTVGPGKCLAVLGPSAAGKTTLLRLVAGLDTLTDGTIRLGQREIQNLSARDRKVAMVFQSSALLPQLTVLENLRLGPKLRHEHDIEDRVRRIAPMVGVTRLLARKPETLSGGEQQRVALGRALMSEPELLLLDEPLASLDPGARGELRDVVRHVQQKLAVTTLYVTHDQLEAAAVADQIALLQGGILQQLGSAADLYLNPRNLFVAQFFGADRLNVLSGRVEKGAEGQVEVALEHDRFPLKLEHPLAVGTKVRLGVRSSNVRFTSQDTGPWQVVKVQDFGWATVVRLGSGGDQLDAQLPSGDCRARPALGSSGTVALSPERLLLFDTDRGERIV